MVSSVVYFAYTCALLTSFAILHTNITKFRLLQCSQIIIFKMSFQFDFNNEHDVQKLLDMDESIGSNDETFIDILKSLKDSSYDTAQERSLMSNQISLVSQDFRKTNMISITEMSPRLVDHATQNDNHQDNQIAYGVNRYKDFMNVPEHALPKITHKNMRGRNQETFPTKLFKVLQHSDAGGYSSIISWLPHGRAFKIHNIDLLKKKS